MEVREEFMNIGDYSGQFLTSLEIMTRVLLLKDIPSSQ